MAERGKTGDDGEITIGVRVKGDVVVKLDRRAETNHRTRSDELRAILDEVLK